MVGESIAAPSTRGTSAARSAESLVVHHSIMDEPLSVKELIQAFLERRTPKLDAHVNEHISERMVDLQLEVDGRIAREYIARVQKLRVFDAATNALRWQNARHQ